MSLSKESIRKLREIQKCILAEPKLYDQRVAPWVAGFTQHTCMTPCCLAGWSEWVNNPNVEAYNETIKRIGIIGTERMANNLGITRLQASNLFSGWSDGKFRSAWSKPMSLAGAKAGAARIEQFIKSGGTK